MREAAFDRELVLHQAMQAFQNKGFASTSMQDLKTVTGLHPGSLYCAFGNKRGLLLAAVDHYVEQRNHAMQVLFDGVEALTGIRRYLDKVVNDCACCDASSACLVAKTLNELGEHDVEIQSRLSGIVATLEARFEATLIQAQTQGQLAPSAQPEQLARFLMLGIYGLRTYAHTHPGKMVLQSLADRLFASLQQDC